MNRLTIIKQKGCYIIVEKPTRWARIKKWFQTKGK